MWYDSFDERPNERSVRLLAACLPACLSNAIRLMLDCSFLTLLLLFVHVHVFPFRLHVSLSLSLVFFRWRRPSSRPACPSSSQSSPPSSHSPRCRTWRTARTTTPSRYVHYNIGKIQYINERVLTQLEVDWCVGGSHEAFLFFDETARATVLAQLWSVVSTQLE